LWRVIPGSLEMGSPDHTVHIILGALFIIGALMTREVAATRLETVERPRRAA